MEFKEDFDEEELPITRTSIGQNLDLFFVGQEVTVVLTGDGEIQRFKPEEIDSLIVQLQQAKQFLDEQKIWLIIRDSLNRNTPPNGFATQEEITRDVIERLGGNSEYVEMALKEIFGGVNIPKIPADPGSAPF